MTRDRRDLAAQHGVGLPRLALGLGLADAGDHCEPRLERRLAAHAHRLVGLAEVLAPLGVPDDRALDAELEQHRRRDLARERALVRPVDVLGVDGDSAPDRGRERRERRADDDLDAVPAARTLEEGDASRPGP